MLNEDQMATKSEFAQKLLHDLRLRKRQLADVSAHNAGDASRNPEDTIEKSGNMNTPERATNDIVPPRSGHQLRQAKGFSMALTYALDDGCQPKSARFLSKGTLMGFFHQTKDRSMQQSPNKQLPSTNELPTITNLEINDIAKETKKLRQILKVRSFSLDFDKGSKEIGSELWRGAMELEQSLKLLANMQESSNKSSLKRVDGDGDEDDNRVITEKQTQVERPVFSFDKASKNRKGSKENEPAPILVDSTFVNGAPDIRPEKQVPLTSKSTSKLSTERDSESKHNTAKIPNVIAKLMGLEELKKEINKKIATENQIISKPRSSVVVSPNEKTKYVKNAETRIQNVVQGNMIAIMKTRESKWNEKDREEVKNGLVVPKEAIFKINELRSQVTEIKHCKTSPKDRRNEIIGATRRKVQAMDDIKRLKPMEVKRQKSEALDEHGVQELKHCGNNERKKKVMTKPIIQQKLKKETQLQQLKVLSKVRSEQIGNKTKPEISEGRPMLKKSPNVKTDVHKLLKKAPMTEYKTTQENALATSEASKGDECINSDGKRKCLANVKNSTSTEVSEVQAKASFASRLDAKLAHESAKKVVNDTKSQKKHSQIAKNGAMSQNLKTTNKPARAIKTHQPRLQKGTQRSSNSEASKGNHILSKPTQKIAEKAKPSTEESQKQVEVVRISTQKNGIDDESHHKEIVNCLPTNEKNQGNTISSVVDQQTVPDEVEEIKSQRTATDGCNDSGNISYDVQPTQIEKQIQLTEDEMHTKQMVIKSNIFLNTAKTLFKFSIPDNILNYANNQNCQDKNSKLIQDCSYEVITREGRNNELLLYSHITTNTGHKKITSLDELVRKLHKDFEILECYGRNESDDQYDYTYVLNMIEKDIMHYKLDADLNSMWEFSWKDAVFACMGMDEVIRDVEKEVYEEVVDEIVSDFMFSS